MKQESNINLPTNTAALRVMLTALLQAAGPNMETLREKEWVQEEIDRLKGQTRLKGDVARHIKATGIVRQMDDLGRIVIPAELRRTMGIALQDPMDIYIDPINKFLVLEPYQRQCHFCTRAKDINEFKGKLICESCMNELYTTV